MTPLDGTRPCTSVERSQWVAHMLQNRETGAWLMAHYRQGAALTREVLGSAEQIGQLTSFFKSIDNVVSAEHTARSRFTLRETLNLWQSSERQGNRDASGRLRKARSFQALFQSPASNPIVTIAQFTDGRVVVDGNHTAISALMCAADQELDTALNLPVYVLTVPSSMEALG